MYDAHKDVASHLHVHTPITCTRHASFTLQQPLPGGLVPPAGSPQSLCGQGSVTGARDKQALPSRGEGTVRGKRAPVRRSETVTRMRTLRWAGLGRVAGVARGGAGTEAALPGCPGTEC